MQIVLQGSDPIQLSEVLPLPAQSNPIQKHSRQNVEPPEEIPREEVGGVSSGVREHLRSIKMGAAGAGQDLSGLQNLWQNNTKNNKIFYAAPDGSKLLDLERSVQTVSMIKAGTNHQKKIHLSYQSNWRIN